MEGSNLKSREELLSYGTKMLERGDNWRSVGAYLNANGSEQDADEVMSQLVKREKTGLITNKSLKKEPIFTMGQVMGLIVMILGVAIYFISKGGYVWSAIPIIMVGTGFLGLTKAIK